VELSRRFRELARERVLGREALVAGGFRDRLLGLAHLDRRQAVPLLIPRCRSVHTFGMRFPLDLYFLDADGAVVACRPGMPPRRFAFCGRASAVLEVPAAEGGEIGALVP
jgi:uncharacterized protein